MAEPTIALRYADLLLDVCIFLGYQPDTGAWSAEETAQADRVIQRGYRKFLYPAGHSWSFISLPATINTVAGTYLYDMPDDFGGLGDNGMTYALTDSSIVQRLTEVSPDVIRSYLTNNQTGWGAPSRFALEVKTIPSGSVGQRYQVMLFPVPQAVYTLTYKYIRLPNKLATNVYPLGGPLHSETVRAAIMAEAEIEMNASADGPRMSQYAMQLAASIELDKRGSGANLGPMRGAEGYNDGQYLRTSIINFVDTMG